MAEKVAIINILSHGLPGTVTRPMYQEYNSRRQELSRIWANPENHYQMLCNCFPVVEALLAMSLFYRHVMGHMEGATSFYKRLNNRRQENKECVIKFGRATLDGQQQRYLLSAIISFREICDKYQLSPSFFEYSETIQFLRNCKELFNKEGYEENNAI